MVAKNGAGAQGSPGSLGNASTSDTQPTSPLEFFGEYDEVTEHPNEQLLELASSTGWFGRKNFKNFNGVLKESTDSSRS